MSTLKDVTLRIPDQWDPVWFRQFVVENLAKADIRAAIGQGITITSDGNSVATLSADAGTAGSISAHNADPFAHASAFSAHTAEADPHPQYLQDAPSDGSKYVRKDGAWVVA